MVSLGLKYLQVVSISEAACTGVCAASARGKERQGVQALRGDLRSSLERGAFQTWQLLTG